MVVERTVDGVKRWCVVHAHPQKPGSPTDKPPGTIIKCWPHTPAGKAKAEAMHRAILAAQAERRGAAVLRAWDPSGPALISGRATHYLFPQRYKKYINEPVFIGDGEREVALGLAMLGEPEPIRVEKLAEMSHLHGMDPDVVKERWPNARQFWMYPVKLIEAFEGEQEYAAGTESGSWASSPVLRQKRIAKVLCFYHSDLDGIASAAVVKRAHPDAELIPINYGHTFPWDKLVEREIVYMVDFGLQPFEDMKKLAATLDEQGSRFVWVDHHKTALEAAEGESFEPEGLRDLEQAGCELTWAYFNPGQPTPPAITYAGRFDVWDHADPDTMPIHYAMEATSDAGDPASEWWAKQLEGGEPDDMKKLAADGRVIDRWLVQFNEGVMKAVSFPVQFGGLDCVAAFTNVPGSMQFDSLKGQHDAAIALKFHDGFWTVSMYKMKDGVDVSAVCAEYGGGGHPGASGFQCDELPFSLPKRQQEPTAKAAEPAGDSIAVVWDAIILKRAPEKRLVTAVVLKPETTDAQGTVMSGAVIEDAAHRFVMKLIAGRAKGIGYMHREFGRNLQLVESFITPDVMMIGGQHVPKGSWVMKVKVLDDEVWQKVLKGEIRGFSIGGRARVSRAA